MDRKQHIQSCVAADVSILKNYLSQGQIAAVRDGEGNILHAEIVGDLASGSFQMQRGFAAWVACHFNVTPADSTAPTGPKRFHGGFFGSEAGGVTLELVSVALAVGYFAGSVDALEEWRAMARDGRLDAVDFCNVQAKPDNHARLGSSRGAQ
jgi:hypothetical protein